MKHEIEIEGLPNGWEAVAFRTGGIGEHVIDCGKVVLLNATTKFPCLIVKKKQPRRIVLEETAEVRTVVYGDHYGYIEDGIYIGQWDEEEPSIHSYKIWREVKETGLSLNSNDAEKSLYLSVDECKEIYQSLCKYHVSIDTSVLYKLRDFLKDKR